jgi:hypothetical protein
MFWRLVAVSLIVPECCTSEPACPFKTLVHAVRSTKQLTNTHTAIQSHSCRLLMATASYNRPTLLAWPRHHQSGSHCTRIFVPGHHMTRSLLRYSKWRQYVDRCVDFLEGLTSNFLFSSQVLTHVRQYVYCLGIFLVFFFLCRTLRTTENVRVLFFFKMYHSLSNVHWSQ